MTPLFFTWQALAEITGGTWTIAPASGRAGIERITDDSRAVDAGTLFIAITGTRVDGHAFLPQVVAAGCAAVVVAQPLAPELVQQLHRQGTGCLQVADSLRALQDLAAAHRRRQAELTVVGITGSSGKTSCKEMLASILEQVWPGAVAKTLGNTNNHFGVPRNLLQLCPQHKTAVFELGTSGPGEIARLAELVQPQVGLICSLGAAHLERLQSREGVAREKAALLAALPPDGVAVIPADSPYTSVLRAAAGRRLCLSFGEAADADVRLTYGGESACGARLRLDWLGSGPTVELEWQLGGRHMASNAAAAAAVATALDIAPEHIVAGLQAVRLPGMRMQQVEQNGVCWINDAYNANPDSMLAALNWFAASTAATSAPPVLVLGDMLELGQSCAAEHRRILQSAQALLPDAQLLAVGPNMSAAARELGLAQYCANVAEACHWLDQRLRPGMRVLLKASRGLGLEQLLQADNS